MNRLASTGLTADPCGVPLSGSRTCSRQRRELRIVRVLRGSEKAVSPAKHPYQVRFRNTDSNAGLLQISDLKKSAAAIGSAAGAATDWLLILAGKLEERLGPAWVKDLDMPPPWPGSP